MIEYERMSAFTKVLLIENMPEKRRLARAIVRMDEKPVSFDDEVTRDGVCRSTNMIYTVCYAPFLKRKTKRLRTELIPAGDFSFQISCDLFYPKGVARFKDWESFRDSKHPVAIWLVRNTNVNKTMFEVAKQNYYLRVPFCINYASYLKKANRIGEPR